MPRGKPSIVVSTPTSTKFHKRQISDVASTPTSGSRSSKRLRESAAKFSPNKSKYFEAADEDEEQGPDSEEADQSGYEDDSAHLAEDSLDDEDEDEDDYESEEDVKPKKKMSRKPNNPRSSSQIDQTVSNNKELWREGVSAGLGPGKQVFIEKPKARSDGGIKYVPGRIHPNTMAFLRDLKANNDREWLKMHDPDYRQAWNDWTSFVEALTEKIIGVDPTIPELPPKDLVFRIYRDIRFSPDPTPYKPHFSAAWSRTGRKGPYACYYVQIQPGGRSFVGSGLWHPEAQPVNLLRRDFDRSPQNIKRVLTDAKLRKVVFNGIPNDEKKAVKAFAAQNSENALKTKPKGYDSEHKDLELLRLRNFTIGKKVKDEDVVGAKGLETITDLIATMAPFVTYLNSVVMPDDADSHNDSDDQIVDNGD